jgi:UDP-N-acetylglucosamine/UDP-N-acetylgalactosamine diphosphorylase
MLDRFVSGKDDTPDWRSLAARAKPPRAIRLHDSHNEFDPARARARGEEALRGGRVGMILVAGGQGTRLGWDLPKGLYPIGPVSGRTLFQVIVDRLRAVARRYGVLIPLYIMTSPATHESTVEYFEKHNWLGLPANSVKFFCQGMLPAVDRETGQVLMSGPSELALSPDGHGGMLKALADSGCLQDAKDWGIEIFFYGQVDNPLLQVCDPEFLGYHLLAQAEVTTQVVTKRFALERVGNVVELDGRSSIIEYSDLPDEVAQRTNPDGSLYLWAGNIAVHAFGRPFLAARAQDGWALPIHRAYKKVPYIDPDGRMVQPPSPNAVKFERFIFDLLPVAHPAMVVEVDAQEAFAPVKNAPGDAVDTPESAQAAMMQRDVSLLRAAGVDVPSGTSVEINPLWALDAAEITAKAVIAREASPGLRIAHPAYLC